MTRAAQPTSAVTVGAHLAGETACSERRPPAAGSSGADVAAQPWRGCSTAAAGMGGGRLRGVAAQQRSGCATATDPLPATPRGAAGIGRSAPRAWWLWLALAALPPAPAQAQNGAPDVPVAPTPPTQVLTAPSVPPAVQALRTASLASHCAACHGSAGRAVVDSVVPGLAGMPAADLAGRMRAFKSGSRPATVMQQIAKGYSDPQIEQLAAYFAAQPK